MTTKNILASMDCHENGDKKACLRVGREKCSALYPQKSLSYDFCRKKSNEITCIDPTEDQQTYVYCMRQVFEEVYRRPVFDDNTIKEFDYTNVEFCRYAFGPTSDIITKKDQKELYEDRSFEVFFGVKGYPKKFSYNIYAPAWDDPRYQCYTYQQAPNNTEQNMYAEFCHDSFKFGYHKMTTD